MRLRQRIRRLLLVLTAVVLLALGAKVGPRWWALHRMTRPGAGAGRIPTMTALPRLPGVPWEYLFRNPSGPEREKLFRDLFAVKLGTYPASAPSFPRAGKHRTMGFSNFEPTEAETERLAAHYDVFYLAAASSHRSAAIKRGNPKAKVLMYFASSLTRVAKLVDAGSVDEENTDWILQNHRDWLLRDQEGRPVEGRSWSVKYWADPRGFLGKEMVEVYLERARRTPQGKMMFLNSATAASFAGNPDLTLFSYFTYLLVAGPEREIYWTCKEGDSEIPHFWYKEFDLDLGPPREERQTQGGVWKRAFANATVVVNPGRGPVTYSFDGECVDVYGQPLHSPLTLQSQVGMLLITNKAILPGAETK